MEEVLAKEAFTAGGCRVEDDLGEDGVATGGDVLLDVGECPAYCFDCAAFEHVSGELFAGPDRVVHNTQFIIHTTHQHSRHIKTHYHEQPTSLKFDS